MSATERARRGLLGIFVSTFFELVGYFMLMPWLLLRLKEQGVSTAVAGLFAATGWLGVLLVTPLATAITRHLGRRPTLWLAAALPTLAALGFALTEALALWFVLKLVSGMASGLRWVLAEALVAEFAPNGRRGRYVGIFETMVGSTFVIGPALLAWLGASQPAALALIIAFFCVGVLGCAWIPPLPTAADASSARVGWHGLWQALRQHPALMLSGFFGGFFESGITSILPLYGLTLGLGAAAAALLVSASGLGSALTMLPVGLLADRLARQPRGRRRLLLGCSALTLLATSLLPWVGTLGALAWPVVFVWGGAGGSLYTLAMIDIGSRESGLALVNGTALLVLSYTVGGLTASAASGALLQWSPLSGFPALLLTAAAASLLTLSLVRERAGG